MTANPINNDGAFAQAGIATLGPLGPGAPSRCRAVCCNRRICFVFLNVENECRVSNPDSGLEVRIVADAEDHVVRYDFLRISDQSAGAPEGGILSMRAGKNGVEFYSADQPLTGAEARALLLDPVLIPPVV